MKRICCIEYSDGTQTPYIFIKKEAKEEQKINKRNGYQIGKIICKKITNDEYNKFCNEFRKG